MLKPLCLRPFVTAEAADYCTLQIAVRCFHVCIAFIQGFPIRARGKELACQCRRHKRCRFHLWFGKIPWRRAGQPTPVFLPGESHGQRSLAGYSPWGCKESARTEATEPKLMHKCSHFTQVIWHKEACLRSSYMGLEPTQCNSWLAHLILPCHRHIQPHPRGKSSQSG